MNAILPTETPLNVPQSFASLAGVDQLRAIFSGEAGYNGMVQTMGFTPVSAEVGEVVFEGVPTRAHFNPLGQVHGGYAATMLDTAMGCAVHSSLKAGQGFTTLELKIAYHRPMSETSGPLRAEGKIITSGKRAAYAEGRLYDNQNRLCASGTTTCLVFAIGE
tara:strand:- start:1066 stop:1551 length:486 start_codon:yes stop_codon:yes gene_type:complete